MRALICENCGAKLLFDQNEKIYFCPHCKSTFMEEEKNPSIVNNTYNNVTNNNVTKIVNGKEISEAREYIDRIENRIELGDFATAEELTMEALEYYPNDVEILMCMVKCLTRNYQKIYDTTHLNYYKKAITLATAEQKSIIEKEYYSFICKRKKAEQEELDKKKKAQQKTTIFVIVIAILVAVLLFIGSNY